MLAIKLSYGSGTLSNFVAAGITIRALQTTFGFATPQAIYKWQSGSSMPTIDNLVVLASIFGCKIDDLLILNKK